MSDLLPIQFTVTDIADLATRRLGSCQWVLVHVKHEEIGSKVVSQTPHLSISDAMIEKRDIQNADAFDREVEEIQIYRITREE